MEQDNFLEFIGELKWKIIANNVCIKPNISDDDLENIRTICRRHVKKEDILIHVITDDDEEGESGIAFTLNGIIHWSVGGRWDQIAYSDIQEVDFGAECVRIKTGCDSISLYCGPDCDEYDYPKKMYNFIYDILDKLQENA